MLGERGKEFGTVTGRNRRCGWFDSVLIKKAVMISGISGLALTKLDVLDDLEEIKVCVGYKIDQKTYDYFPLDEYLQNRIEPIYKTMPGWETSTFGFRD